jgi:hypothetical protein
MSHSILDFLLDWIWKRKQDYSKLRQLMGLLGDKTVWGFICVFAEDTIDYAE